MNGKSSVARLLVRVAAVGSALAVIAAAVSIVALAHGGWSATRSSRFANTRSCTGLTWFLSVFAHHSCTRRPRPPTLAQRLATLEQ